MSMKGRLTPLAALLCVLAAAGAALADPRDHDGRRGGWGGEGRGRGGPPAYAPRYDPRMEGRAPAPRYDGYGRYAPPPPPVRAPAYPPPPPYGAYEGGRNSLGADWGQQQDEARRGVSQGRIVPLNRVLQTLRQRIPGRVLDAGMEEYGSSGRPAYRVRWAAAGGRRVDVIVDAVTGAILYSSGR
jgi:hypothetical protein